MADPSYDPDRYQTERPSGVQITKVRPKLTREDAERVVRKYNPDITDAAVKGEVDNIVRESGINPGNTTGDGGTSGGAYQHHLSRLTNLKSFAEKEGKPWTDFETQVKFSRLEKERDYPKLLAFQQTNDDRSANEESFKRIFERPASVLWQNNAEGKPVTETPKFRFSDYAMKEFMEQPDTDIRFMDPKEYLQLTPPLEGKPFQSPSGRSLKKSVDQGDQIEQIPSLDVSVQGPTAQVTDQDGRHRALMAEQNGIQAIPVAVKGLGKANPTEIVGTNGVPQAFDHPRQPRQETPEQPREPISLLRQAADAIIPRAEAAEGPKLPDWMAKGAAPEQPQQPTLPDWMKNGAPAETGVPAAARDVSQMSVQQAQSAQPPLTDDEQRAFVDAQQAQFGRHGPLDQVLSPDNAAAATRGASPYAAGALAGAGLAAPTGVGIPFGAAAGAGAVGIAQLLTGLTGLATPQDATNKLLDLFGVRKTVTPGQRVVENSVGAAANAMTGAGAAGALVSTLKNPTSKAVALWLSQAPGRQAVGGALGGAASQETKEQGYGPGWQAAAGFLGGMAPGGVNALRGLVRGGGNLASHLVGSGGGTHTGAEPLKQAFRAGAEGGQKAQLFLDALRDDAPQGKIVATAKQALDSMRKSRNSLYQSGMVDVRSDASVLDFTPLETALANVRQAAVYGGKVTNAEAAGKLKQIEDVVQDWKNDDPTVFHTPEGFDALKRRIGEIWQTTTPHTQARLIVGRAYDAIKDTIVQQVPAYARTMKDYEEASDAIRELESAFSLGEKKSIDTALRKLQSVMRNNVNTNYGYRTTLADTMNNLVGGKLTPQLAGRALSSVTPRGLGGVVTGIGLFSALMGHPGALAALPFESPRAMGEAAYYLGKLRGLLPIPKASSANALQTLPAAARAAALPTQ